MRNKIGSGEIKKHARTYSSNKKQEAFSFQHNKSEEHTEQREQGSKRKAQRNEVRTGHERSSSQQENRHKSKRQRPSTPQPEPQAEEDRQRRIEDKTEKIATRTVSHRDHVVKTECENECGNRADTKTNEDAPDPWLAI